MGIFGAGFSHPTSILPIFLLAVGIGDSVHLLALFFRQFAENRNKEASIIYTLRHSGLPVVMTSLTTAAGLLSFSAAGMLPVANLGLFGGLGVIIALIYTLILIPVMVSLIPLKPRTLIVNQHYGAKVDRILESIANFSIRRAGSIVCVSFLIVAISAVGLTWQKLAHNTNDWLPYDSDFRESINLMDQEFGGPASLEVVVDTGEENGLYNPEMLNKIEELGQYAQAYRRKDGTLMVGNSDSILNVLKEAHQSLNQNNPEYYKLPQSRQLIAQELLLFENSGSDDLEPLVDSQFSKARLSLKTKNSDATTYMAFVETMERKASDLFSKPAHIVFTGAVKIFSEIMHMMVTDMARSYIIAGVVITIMMMLFLSSIRLGLISLIPNVSPIIITLGLLGWIGIYLDMSNMLIGTIAIGLAVDDTIHFLHNYRRYYSISGNTEDAVRQTLLTSGRPIVFTTVILMTGFLLYMKSVFPPLFTFGLALGSTLGTALLADILLVPAILVLIDRWKNRG